MSKKKNKDKNLVFIIVVVLIISVIIITIEYSTINFNNKLKEEKLNKSAYENSTEVKTSTKNDFYDISHITFHPIEVSEESKELSNLCFEGCNLNIKNRKIAFILNKNKETGEYRLDLVRDNKAILENKSLGTSLENSKLKLYAGYLTLELKFKNANFFYDYALFVDEKGDYDEISSLKANEMEFLENGIVYYYDVCDAIVKGVGKKVKAVRAPFSDQPAIISSTPANFEWCN